MRDRIKQLGAALLTVMPLFGPCEGWATSIDYHVAVDTSRVAGTPGFLDFQFNPDGVGSQDAMVTISHFSFSGGGGSLAASSDILGAGSGVLPSNLTIQNTSDVNDVFQEITYGDGFGFDLSLSGVAVDLPAGIGPGSSFLLFLFDDAVFPLLTVDPDESVLTLLLKPTGNVEVTTFESDANGGGSVVKVTNGVGQVVSEPSVLLLLVPFLVWGVCGSESSRVLNSTCCHGL